MPKWTTAVAINIEARELKSWLLSLDVGSCTRGKYRGQMSHVYEWAKSEELIPEFVHRTNGIVSSNPCTRVKGPEFSQESAYEALALEVEDTIKLLSEINGKNGEYEIALLVATCGLRISEALGLQWRDIAWDKGYARIRQTYVHSTVQEGAKTRLSRSRVEVPRLALNVLAAWKRSTMYAAEDDYVFPSTRLHGEKPRSATILVRNYLRPAAIRAGILIEKPAELFSKEGDRLSRFGFHNLGRHSLASFLMHEQANPAVVQSDHAPFADGHDALLRALVNETETSCARPLCRADCVSPQHCAAISGPSISVGDRGQGSELWCYHELTAVLSGSSSAVERQLPKSVLPSISTT